MRQKINVMRLVVAALLSWLSEGRKNEPSVVMWQEIKQAM